MKILTEAVEMVPVTSINPHPKNPRQGDLEVIKRSIQKNGFYGAIVVQKSSGFILAGNHRFMAACSLGMTRVPVVYVDVDDLRARAILAADNRTSDLGGYSDASLASLLKTLQGADMLEDTGYDDDDLESLLAKLSGDDDDESSGDSDSERDEPQTLEEKWGTARGQVWRGERKGASIYVTCANNDWPNSGSMTAVTALPAQCALLLEILSDAGVDMALED